MLLFTLAEFRVSSKRYRYGREKIALCYKLLMTFLSLAVALRDGVIKVDDRPDGAKFFFTTNLRDLVKATRVH
jgi:hypothetical protein